MKIEIVQLENIRSHLKSTVPFARGFNCLVGGLGCGKSSILYSIDFAFFGDPIGRSYEYLLREGAQNGRVTVQFVQHGKTYKIIRGLKRRGKGISQNMDDLKLLENEKLISSVKGEAVAEQMKAITGFDKDLFREIVWVRQEHLKELLDARPRDRQTRLDELFGLSDYEAAWANLAEYSKEYEVEKRILERDPDIIGLERLSAEHNRTVEEYSKTELEIVENSKKLLSARRELDEADSALKRLEEVRNLAEEHKRKATQIQTALFHTRDSLRDLTSRTETKSALLENLRKRLSLIESQVQSVEAKLKEAGIVAEQSIEDMRLYLTALDDHITNLKAEQESNMRSIQTDQRRLLQLSAENRCPLCLQPLNEEYKNDMTERIQIENDERQKKVTELRNQVNGLISIKNVATSAVSELQGFNLQAEQVNSRLAEEEKALSDCSKELEEKRSKSNELELQLEAVNTEAGKFDVSELETAKAVRDEAYGYYLSVKSDLQKKEDRKKEQAKLLDELKERIDQAQHKIDRMGKIVKASGIVNSIRDSYRNVQPKLRFEFVKVLRNFVQQVLDTLVGRNGETLNVMIDETYTPFIKSEAGVEREVSNLSGGERTLIAFGYRLGLGQLIMQSKTGQGLSILMLDEPTESLGREDGSVDRLAEAISRFKAIEQIIAVTHSEAFAEKAEHVIRLEKEAGVSKVSVER